MSRNLNDPGRRFERDVWRAIMGGTEPGPLLDNVVPNRRREPPKKALSVVVRDALDGPWSGNNNLGYETAFAPDTNNRQVILKLPEWGMPGVWTLMLGLRYTRSYWPLTAPYSYFEIKAELTIGSGGTTQDMVVDWKRGASVTMPMNALNVHAVYSFPAGTPSFPPDLRLIATLSQGPASKPWNASYTARMMPSDDVTLLYTAGNANTLVTPIPQFAQKVVLFPENLNNVLGGNLLYSSDTVIGFGSGAGGTNFYMIYFITGDLLFSYPDGLVIPSGAETLLVYNPAGYDQVRSTAIFQMAG